MIRDQLHRFGRTPCSIFWKIFLWFWLATILIVAVAVLVIVATEPQLIFGKWKMLPLTWLSDEATRCAEIYETQGAEALDRYLAELPRHMTPAKTGGISVDDAYLFSPGGTALTNRRPTSDLAALVTRATNIGDIYLQMSFGKRFAAESVTRPDGKSYVFVVSTPENHLFWPLDRGRGWGIVAGILVATFVCYGLARYLVKPILELRSATQDFASGNLGIRISQEWLLQRGDEFAELATDFNNMASRIENLVGAQRRLIADISHELRSPLTRMNVALELAFRDANPETQLQLQRIEREAKRSSDLIHQMLLLAELENQKKYHSLQQIDLSQLVQAVVSDADFEARNANRSVSLIRCDVSRIDGIEELLRRAMENVIRNAVRYTANQTVVTVQLIAGDTHAEDVTILVTDQGPGVPAEELKRIFRPFYRVSEARDRISGGVGLGLAIAKRAIEVHGGQIEARNLARGGLQVEIRLSAQQQNGQASTSFVYSEEFSRD